MARNIKTISVDTGSANGNQQVKNHGESSFIAKKNQDARETLQKFPVPEKYAK